MSKEKLQKIILIALVVCAVIYGYVFELYLPALQKLDILKTTLKNKKEGYEDAKKKAADYNALINTAKKAELDLLFAMRRLPTFINQAECIKEISRAAAEYNLRIQSFTPSKVIAGKSFYNEVPIALSLSGSYNDFGKFITKLGYSVRLFNCYDVQVSAGGATGETVLSKSSVNMAVNIKTFVSSQNPNTQARYFREEDTEERAIFPLYRYSGVKRDPFLSVGKGDAKATAGNLNIIGLRLTSVLAIGNSPIFIFEDSIKNAFMLRDKKLYTKDNELIKGIEGRVYENKVKLFYTEIVEVGAKEIYFDIPK